MSKHITPLLVFCLIFSSTCTSYIPQYYCTGSNSKYFEPLLNLIGSIHKTNFQPLEEIAVFDIGLTKEQKNILSKIRKVNLYSVERVNPNIITPIPCREGGRTVPGAYTWKHVIVKQALDMFPYVLYIDAAALVLKPIDIFFQYLKQKGYFFRSGDKRISDRTTNYVKQIFNLNSPSKKWILDSQGLESNFMGFTHKVYDDLVIPMYELAKDLKAFTPDGSSPKSFRSQSLYSIQVRLLGLQINVSPYHLEFNNKKVPFEIRFMPRRPSTYIQVCRWENKTDFSQFIHYKD